MTVDQRIRDLLAAGDLRGLFLDELGWDQPGIAQFTADIDGHAHLLRPIAQKRGLHVLEAPYRVGVPSADTQHRIDMEAARRAPERLLVFTSPARQIWRWPEPRKSGGLKLIPHETTPQRPSTALIQKLAGVRFEFSEEDAITLPLVKDRVRSQFSAERVTARFYERFEKQHAGLQSGLEGIRDPGHRHWYASVLMNRLMFIYFMQKKGFLNGDRYYLRTCLAAIRRLRGPDEFYGFYRDVLLPMFHDGFGSFEHSYDDPEIAALLGDVPYVDGGIFEEHEIEAANEIRVRDEEFERIFEFFDDFTWHLDDRPHGDPDAINPDVIGYIFERYINLTSGGKKEGGAYYTKEDVTGYMVSATVLPRLLERLIDRCGVNPFVALQAAPRRYVPEALLHGADPIEGWTPLPDPVESNQDAPLSWGAMERVERDPALQLADETWVETVDRRHHVDELLADIAVGTINTVDELVARNLDVRTLLADVIHALDSPADIAAAWLEVSATTIIDPTCGSGAFLFAALDVLDDVYAALLERARTHLATGSGDALEHVGRIVADADEHANDAYYRRKHAALSNLYGLDLMHEAVETAKLRLFLALASKLEARTEIEPLPDLDFNLRAGNLLIGFFDVDDARGRVGATTFDAMAAVDGFLPKAQHVGRLRERFVQAQRDDDPERVVAAKRALADTLDDVRVDADRAYATAAGVDHDSLQYSDWWMRSQPFHWMLEFPRVLEAGGFDVVVGNPPYIARSKITYSIDGYRTGALPDVYAPCVERSLRLLGPRGRFAMILPIAFQFSERHKAARQVVLDQGAVWVSTYSRNPSALFTAGLGVRSVIAITSPEPGAVETTATRRWQKEARETLFPVTRYSPLSERSRRNAWLPRTGDRGVAELLEGLRADGAQLSSHVVKRSDWPLGFKVTALYYLPVYTRVPPVYNRQLEIVPPPKDSAIYFASEKDRLLAYALLAGELALVWWASTGDDFDVTAGTLKEFPISFALVASVQDELLELARTLEAEAHQPEHLLFTPYAGLMTGSWDLRRLRDRTREIDRLILKALGLDKHLPAVLRAVSRFGKSTGERPGTERDLSWLDERRAALASHD